MNKVVRTATSFRFGVYDLDLPAQELRKGGVRIRLQPKPFQVLTILLERAGTCVTREELAKLLWAPNTFVDFDHGLNSAVNKIRDALCDSAESPRFIETLPKGYRFIATVDHNSSEVQDSGLVAPVASSPEARKGWYSGPLPRAASVATLFLLTVISLFLLRGRLFVDSPRPAIKWVAVLPLRNLSGDADQDYFSDSMTDEMITELTKISDLQVSSTASVMVFKNHNPSASEIRRVLKVDAFIYGTVARSGNEVRVNAQLVDANTNRHIWAQDYNVELPNTFLLQNNIATAIARSVQANIHPTNSSTASHRKVDPRAYDAYLRGRGYWFRSKTANALPDDIERSGELFKEAVQYDPTFAAAYSGLANYYGLKAGEGMMPAEDGWRQSEEASRKALALDDQLAEAHCALASKMMFYDWDWAGAEQEIQRGLELDAHYAELHSLYSHLLAYTGRFDQSIAQAHRAEELDPLAQQFDVQRALRFSRRFDLFLLEVNKVFAQDPARVHRERAAVYQAKKQYVEEVRETDQQLRLEGCVLCADLLSRAYARGGYSGWLGERLRQLDETSKDGNARSFEHAELYAAMGKTDMTMQYLERGYREHTVELVRLGVNPAYDGMRNDARFQDLVHRIGLPQ